MGLHSLLGGLLGAAVGVVIWVVVGYSTQYEIGWIAWAVGFLTGVGVRYGGRLRNDDAGIDQGMLSAGLAIAAILAAKYVVFLLLAEGQDIDVRDTLARYTRQDQEGILAGFADEAAAEAMDRGETLAWPPGMSPEAASKQKDYPPNIWQQAERRWQELGPEKQEKEKNKRLALSAKLPRISTRPSFTEAFSPWDILWFGLALVTAMKIGSGAEGT